MIGQLTLRRYNFYCDDQWRISGMYFRKILPYTFIVSLLTPRTFAYITKIHYQYN